VGEMRTGVRRVRFQPILAPERGPPFGLSSVRTVVLLSFRGVSPATVGGPPNRRGFWGDADRVASCRASAIYVLSGGAT